MTLRLKGLMQRINKVTENKLLKSGERAAIALRSLYKENGYLSFKMSKFEEYDLYVRNKEFLIGDSVITFNDTDGRLLALKPDVTLSIIKNAVYEKGVAEKVYYNENVYRISAKTHTFKEILQSGIECTGDIDAACMCEVITLAAKSLSLFSEDFVLDISHLGLLSALLASASQDAEFKTAVGKLISEKNKHGIRSLCSSFGIGEEKAEQITGLVDMCGNMSEVLSALRPLSEKIGAEDSYNELSLICKYLAGTEFADRIHLDFSVVNDMNYYNGIVFKGFLRGIPEGILAGGEYGTLMARMGKSGGAVGFAVYLDLLEELLLSDEEYDVDALLIYGADTSPEKILAEKERLIGDGKSVSVQRAVPEKLRYKEIIKI